jgi:hypothetical protein
MSRRKHFSQSQLLDVLIGQGVMIPCGCGCGGIITKGSEAIREHLWQLGLGGPDTVKNCQFWLKECSHRKSHGTAATTAGSDTHARAKAKRMAAGGRKHKGPKIKSRPFQTNRKGRFKVTMGGKVHERRG